MEYFKVKITNNIGCSSGAKTNSFRCWYYDKVGEIYDVYICDDENFGKIYHVKDSNKFLAIENCITLQEFRKSKLNTII